MYGALLGRSKNWIDAEDLLLIESVEATLSLCCLSLSGFVVVVLGPNGVADRSTVKVMVC